LKFYFLKKQFEIPYYWGVVFPERFTFAISQEKLPPKGSFIIINDLTDSLFYLAKVKNKGKITTFDHRISCVETKNVKLLLEDVIKTLNLKGSRFKQEGEICLITDREEKVKKLKNYLIDKNPSLKNYFNIKSKAKNLEMLDLSVESRDAFSTAFELFKLPPRYVNLTEEQILDWEFNSMPDIMKKTPDGKYFLDFNNRKLIIQKVHNTPIERCLGVDMIYHFCEEDRLIFIQYKCFNHKNKGFYKSRDKHLPVEIKKMLSFSEKCKNHGLSSCDQLRICDCPFFIKLCSREVPSQREKPYGFYYSVCSWDKMMEHKTSINFDDEPKISNTLFESLIDGKLIGTRRIHARKILKKLRNSVPDGRLLLVFSEMKGES